VPHSLVMSMAATPRPWYRSPALWFALPGVVFLAWAWVFSMQRVANLDFELGGYSVRFQNDGSAASASWQNTSARRPLTFPSAKGFHFEVEPRPPWASTEWFPLPSYATNRISSTPWHYLELPYWFLLMIYAGLWQLPWLARYHRRRRIDRKQVIGSADAVNPDGQCMY
jgi:hypothetical protein